MNNQKGSVIVVALIVLCIMTILGVTSIRTAIFNSNITVNFEIMKKTFYATEAGNSLFQC